MAVLERIESVLKGQDWGQDTEVAALRLLGAICSQLQGICDSEETKIEAEGVLKKVAQQCVEGLVAAGKARSMMATRTVKSILRAFNMPDDALDLVFEEDEGLTEAHMQPTTRLMHPFPI